MKNRRVWYKVVGFVGALLALPFVVHAGLVRATRLTPPTHLTLPTEPTTTSPDGTRHMGRSEVALTDGLILVRLVGTPEQIGAAHARLLGDELIDTERKLLGRFSTYVRSTWAQTLLMDLARLRFYDLPDHMATARLRELGAMAAALPRDPFADFVPTYQRFVYLNALYDISLSFEESPLIGCTTFVVKGAAAKGHVLFARNFDFEVDPIFDVKKTLYVVHESDSLPFASLSWPGLVGVVTGVNQAGLAVVVHGGRAGELDRTGEPVIHTLRHALSAARDVEQAVDIISRTPPMVSHIIILADAQGNTAVLERVPHDIPYRYALPDRAAVTNHLLGPGADDPRNQRVMANTSTLQRKQRGDQLVARLAAPVTPSDMVALLRDRKAINDVSLPLGDWRAIDAFIAAHGIVLDLTAKKLFVSHAPHLLGGFIELDLTRLFEQTVSLASLRKPEDVILTDPLSASGSHPEPSMTHHESASP